MKNVLIAILLTLTSCSIEVRPKELQVNGTIQHQVTVNENMLFNFYKFYCQSKLGSSYTQEQLDQCMNESLALFWAAIGASTPPGQIVNTNQGGN